MACFVMIIYIIIIGQFGCLSVTSAKRDAQSHRPDWAGCLAGQGLSGPCRPAGHCVCIAARRGRLAALRH